MGEKFRGGAGSAPVPPPPASGRSGSRPLMTSALGIDAAWTMGNPSGVALAVHHGSGWRLVAASPSYDQFLGQDTSVRPAGTIAPVGKLLQRCATLAGGEPLSVAAVDMPLSRDAITQRREADNAVSRRFGNMKCGTHSPNEARPGRLSAEVTAGFERQGWELATRPPLPTRSLIEVYPHPALARLCGAQVRLPYKYGKTRAYWPSADRTVRLAALRETWVSIVERLDQVLLGAGDRLLLPELGAPGWMMKAFEDTLDAVVCAWVGVCALEGRAEAYGDHKSAIWVPL
jgi:predicted RNase H-like nuclease